MNNYRDILKQYLADKQKGNPSFSLRGMARKLDLTPSMLSSVLKGDKNLSPEKAYQVAEKIGLDEKNTEFFLRLVELERAKNSKLKDKIYEDIKKNFADNEYTNLSVEKVKIISQWFHFAILELTLTDSPPKTAEDIAKRLGLSIIEAELAVDRLLKVGLLGRRDNGTFKKLIGRLQVASEEKNLALRDYHKQTLSKAMDSIETQKNDEKYIGSETFPFNKENLKEANEILEEAFTKILALSSKGPQEEVYHLGIQLFKLTDSKSDRRLQ